MIMNQKHIYNKAWVRRALALFTLLPLSLFTFAQTWKTYLSYYEPTEIEQATGNTIYVLASNGLYSYNTSDKSLQTYDKTTVLSDCDIAHIAWCQKAKRLVIVYANQNIDLLEQNDNVINMADYMNKSMIDDKTVNSIDIDGAYAYLSTGFGIVCLNVADATLSNTYSLGFNVNYSYVDDGYLYAASQQQGLWRGRLTDNLLDKANWRRVGNYSARQKTMDPDLLALVNTLNPGGPKYNHFGDMKFTNGSLYTVPGGYNVTTDLNLPGAVQVLSGDNWFFFEDSLQKQTGVKYVDQTNITINPKNPSQVWAAGRTGLYEFNDGTLLKLYNSSNSPIVSVFPGSSDMTYHVVFGTAYDNKGNLWLLNSMATSQSLFKYTANGEWESHHQSALANSNNQSLAMLCSPLFDSRGLLWIANNNWQKPSFYCYQPSSGGINSFASPFTNEDGTSITLSNGVRCIAEDKNSNIWIGTDQGPFMLESDQITATNPILTQVKVPRNDGTDYADYLLTGVDISCILIDQNNRKWFGTAGNGLYLISSDNIHQLQHFTAENSKLLSDNIESLAINESTGEVFIGTNLGLCSYTNKSLPTGEGMMKDNVWAYPNPVRPDYRGAITIVGLEDDADVKIVTSNGTLVNQGRASGGEYKWYGIDQNSGKRVASGVYMVEIATATGEKGVVCKIAIVN